MHTEVTRQDEVIRTDIRLERICGQDTYKRFFGKFTQGMNQRVFTLMYRWFFQGLQFEQLHVGLGFFGMTRYGDQEGARLGTMRGSLGGSRTTR